MEPRTVPIQYVVSYCVGPFGHPVPAQSLENYWPYFLTFLIKLELEVSILAGAALKVA